MYHDAPQAYVVGSFNALEPTDIGSAFQAMTMEPPNDSQWCMDTGASSHLAVVSSKLIHFSDQSHIKSIFVGNGHNATVRGTGHTKLLSKPKFLIHHNVLYTPDIVKNLVSVRQFAIENHVSIELILVVFL